MIVDGVLEYTIDGIHRYLQIGALEPGEIAILLEPRYGDQNLRTGEYLFSENKQWTIGIHVRPIDQLSGAEYTYNADIILEFDDVATDVFTDEVYPAIVEGVEDEFDAAEFQYLDPDDL